MLQPMLEGVIEIVQQLSQFNNSSPAGNGNTGGIQPPTRHFDEEMPGFPVKKLRSRHLHFLYLSKENILRYVIKLMIVALKVIYILSFIDCTRTQGLSGVWKVRTILL